jgi:KaiC/GvpD/RAD55 family RecA-like ATPase
VVIDSLMDLQMAAVDDTRFREFMYSLSQRFSRQGISLLTTYETSDPFSTGRLPEFAVSHLADNAIALTHYRDHAAMSRSLAIIKTRASNHDPAIRQFSIGPDGISLADIARPGHDVNHGRGQPRRGITGGRVRPAGRRGPAVLEVADRGQFVALLVLGQGHDEPAGQQRGRGEG